MEQFAQQLLNGLFLGSIYALIALGYTMVYGVLRFINFAHGDVFMLGAFAGLYLNKWLGPALGEHTDAVLMELGYTDNEIAEMHQNGAI